MDTTWSTTVSEVVDVFRNALIAIVPWLEKARIGWREGDAYDDWDNISNALYENIVCSSLFGEVAQEYDIVGYDFITNDYSRVNFILVRTGQYEGNDLAFVSFQSIDRPMDMIKVAVLEKSGSVVERKLIRCNEVEFVFVKRIGGTMETVRTMEVLL